MPQQPTAHRHLRDAATLCPATINVPGEGALHCERDTGHDGKHAHHCMRWGSTKPVTVQ